MTTRIGVDIGGTFTDLILYDDERGDVTVAKVQTTSASPDEGVVNAVSEAVPEEALRRAEFFLHGTTVGLNALLERRGAKVGLLATNGFRDILEIRRGDRDEMYNLFWTMPPPLVPRRLRLPVSERVMATGEVHTPLNPDDIEQAAATFADEGVDSVAIAFLHAYANPEHELEAERLLRESGFEGEISLSHRVSGEYREYERTCTTVIDAFVGGRTSRYLQRLGESLEEVGFSGSLLVTRSGSGCMTFAEAEDRPFETINSGPVAGAEGAGELARNLGLGDIITADVGGTSFDTCLVLDGRPQIMYEGKVVGLPVQTPWVDVRSIGAGGGSIAHVDVGGLLRVGPQSAGADPGPASYGKGGDKPTVTDAALILGMLGSGELASGITLDVQKASDALKPVADELSFSVEETARGVMTIVGANMANAIREITVEQGVDPRGMKLLAFGGAGPLMSTLLARELDIDQVIVPPYAGNFSAWGLLGADLTQSVARTKIMKLSEDCISSANDVLTSLFAELESRQSKGLGSGTSSKEVGLDMRYVGQEHWLTVSVATEDGRIVASEEEIGSSFAREYERTFGGTMDEAAEIVSIRATLRIPLPRRKENIVAATGADESETKTLEAYSFTRGSKMDFKVVQRESLELNDSISGPAIIEEETATTYLDADFEARVDKSGCLMATYSGGAR